MIEPQASPESRHHLRVRPAVLAPLLVLSLAVNGFLAWLVVGEPWRARAASAPPAPAPADADWPPQLRRQLESLGYLAAYSGSRRQHGVTVYDRAHAQAGLNLVNTGSGPEATLMDMSGTVLHRWRHVDEGFAAWSGRNAPEVTTDDHGFWRRVRLRENGELLAIVEGEVLLKLSPDSKLQWAYRGFPHHEMLVRPDGSVVVLVRRAEPREVRGEKVLSLEDAIAVLDASGREQQRFSLRGALERSPYAALLRHLDYDIRRGSCRDPFHTNTLTLAGEGLARKLPGVRADDLLVSMRNLDLVGVIRPSERRFVWALAGLWSRQHDPHGLKGGDLLVFDNEYRPDRSRVVAIDPLTHETRWQYDGTAERPLHSPILGACQRLPNGNTLITESTQGRAVEVTATGKVVWEFLTPEIRTGGKVQSLLEVTRLPADFPLAWLRQQRRQP